MILGYFLLLLFVFLSGLGMSVFVLCPFLLWFSEIPLSIPCSGYLNFPSSTFGGFWIASRVCVACGSLFLKEVVNELSQLLQLLSLRRKAIGFLNVVFFFPEESEAHSSVPLLESLVGRRGSGDRWVWMSRIVNTAFLKEWVMLRLLVDGGVDGYLLSHPSTSWL
jgi:hypothetical protein